MDQPDAFAECFPRPREDEPASLRQDIADELADHLASSLRRQLISISEEDLARARVLDRFGNPQDVARQLWFDAMKEKLMSQRLNLVVSSMMAAVCLAALGMVIVVFRDSQALNAAILARLEALTSPAPVAPSPVVSTSPSEWTRARFKLVQAHKDGPPAVGFNVQLQGNFGNQAVGETEKNGHIVYGVIEETSNEDGIADLGMFRYGGYTLQVRAPWGESIFRQIGLRPGQEEIREVVCPISAPEQADVEFHVDWPEDVQAQKLWLLFSFANHPTRHVGVDDWSLPSPASSSGLQAGMGGMGMGGLVAGYAGLEMLLVNADGKVALRNVKIVGQQEGWSNEHVEFTAPSRFDGSVRLPALAHQIGYLTVIDPIAVNGRWYQVLAKSQPTNRFMGGMGGGFFSVGDEGNSSQMHEGAGLSFEPRPGVMNRWKITLSDEMLDRVRAELPKPAAQIKNE